ncbi:hypothetical protein XENOCAPTIV_027294 [Xenoophorus captivus]|uniref:Uncharacterized protein n=1 Tax=Xenoophorus captivus TaxID=1517983 RepID=A0ABV0RJ37_9TELE
MAVRGSEVRSKITIQSKGVVKFKQSEQNKTRQPICTNISRHRMANDSSTGFVQTLNSSVHSCPSDSSSRRHLPLYPGPGRGGSRLSRDTHTSISPDTSSSSSGGSPRRSQASRET